MQQQKKGTFDTKQPIITPPIGIYDNKQQNKTINVSYIYYEILICVNLVKEDKRTWFFGRHENRRTWFFERHENRRTWFWEDKRTCFLKDRRTREHEKKGKGLIEQNENKSFGWALPNTRFLRYPHLNHWILHSSLNYWILHSSLFTFHLYI